MIFKIDKLIIELQEEPDYILYPNFEKLDEFETKIFEFFKNINLNLNVEDLEKIKNLIFLNSYFNLSYSQQLNFLQKILEFI